MEPTPPKERPAAPVPPPPGMPSLQTAAKTGSMEALRWWIETASKSPNFRDAMNGNTLLHSAGGAGQVEAVRYLLARGADANKPCQKKNGGGIPLHHALNHPECVQELLRSKADPNAACIRGTALHMACNAPTGGHAEDATKQALLSTARLLLDAGADPQAKRQGLMNDQSTPLQIAHTSGFTEMAELLATRGGDAP